MMTWEDDGKQRSKELVVVSVSPQTEDPMVQAEEERPAPTAVATLQCVVGLPRENKFSCWDDYDDYPEAGTRH